MPFSTSVLDNFNRANENPLSGGGNWAKVVSSAGTVCVLTSDQVGASSSSTGESYWTPATFGPDCEAYITISVLPGTGKNVRLYARLQQAGGAGTQDGYMVQFSQASGTDGVAVYRCTNNAFTALGSFSQEFSAGDKLGIRCIGSSIEAWYCPSAGSWTLLGSATDTNYALAGNLAIGISGTGGRIDDFGGGDATAIVTGAAALTGSGTIAAAGTRVVSGAATLTGAGTVAAAGFQTSTGAASLTGQGSLTAAGGVQLFGAVSMSGLGTLTAAGAIVQFGAAALTGLGTLTVSGTVTSSPHLIEGTVGTGYIDFPDSGYTQRPGTGRIVTPTTGSIG